MELKKAITTGLRRSTGGRGLKTVGGKKKKGAMEKNGEEDHAEKRKKLKAERNGETGK